MSDFTNWYQENQDGVLAVHGSRVYWKKANRTALRYIGMELETASNYSHRFTVCIEEGYVEDELNRGLIRLWELRCDWDNRVWIYARKENAGWTIHYEQRHQGQNIWDFNGDEPLIWGKMYVVELKRIGNLYGLKVLDEKTGIKLVECTIEGVNQSYNQIWIASTIKSRRNNCNFSTGYIEELAL